MNIDSRTFHIAIQDRLDLKLFEAKEILQRFWQEYYESKNTKGTASDCIFSLWFLAHPELDSLIETNNKSSLILVQEITRFVEERTQAVLRILETAPEA